MSFNSLKTKFIVVMLLASLVTGGATLLAFNSGAGRIINDLALRFGTKEALLEKNKIISIIDREVALAQKMADDTTLRRWAVDEGNREFKANAFAELESYRKIFRDKSFFIALKPSGHYYVYNKRAGEGRVDMVTLDAAKPHDKWFFDGLAAIDNYALNLDYNPTLQETKVWFNAIMTGRDGRKIGICGGGITLTDFLNEIVHIRQKGLSTILMDRSGVIQAHEDRSIVEHNANVRDITKKITIFGMIDGLADQERLREAVKTLSTGSSEVQAFPVKVGGKSYLLAVACLQGMGWFNVVLVDVSRVVSMNEFMPIIGIMFLALLLVIFTISALVNRMVLVPLTRLSGASREIAAGHYDVVLPVTGDDELGSLTGTFNSMSSTILDQINNLEAKVQERTEELTEANLKLEESQQRIMASITYARIIQTSILPDQSLLDRCLGEHFILYCPKQIVGGDFYYLREFERHFLLAVIDCTGHGVPGAFMTMTANAVLNHVVDVECNDNPARILSGLNRRMRSTLHMNEVDAGLDIAVCMVERQAKRLIFAGAGLSLYFMSGGEVQEVRGNHQRIGYKSSRTGYEYTNHEVKLAIGDGCYLTTDGLLDEPDAEKGFGFGAERFKKLLAGQANVAMQSQRSVLEQAIVDYRGCRSQRDDITVVGFRIK